MRVRTRRPLCFLLTVALMGALIIEGGTSLSRDMRRRQAFRRAQHAAHALHKPLVVVGDPHQGGFNSVFGASYGCGNVCLDLTGCPRCAGGSSEDLLTFFSRQPSHSMVVFESCVMESIPAAQRARITREMRRVAASLNTVRIGPTLLMRLLYLPRLWTGEPQMQSDWR